VKFWRPAHPRTREPLPGYRAGSQGPAEAQLILRDGDHWRAI